MATNYPTSNDFFSAPSDPATTTLSSGGDSARNHGQWHQDASDALNAIEVNASPLSHNHSGTESRPTTPLIQANTHGSPDTDAMTTSLHHTLGSGVTQAAAGNHTHPQSITVVNSFTQVPSPTPDQIIYLNTNGLMYTWNGTVFYPVSVFYPDIRHARYISTDTSTLTSGQSHLLSFGTLQESTSLISVSSTSPGTNNTFTFNMPGVYNISYKSFMLLGSHATGGDTTTYCILSSAAGGPTIDSSPSQAEYNGPQRWINGSAFNRYFNQGDQIQIYIIENLTGPVCTLSNVDEIAHIDFVYHGA